MTVEDGLILKGEALIIPPLEREKILQTIHKGHLGITKCQYHARQCIYWPGIYEDIKKMVETCQCHHPQEPRQPLQPTPAPEHPWQHMGADFFTFDGFKYLVIIDYYTKMSFIRKIPPSQCNAAKTISISQCSRSCSPSMESLKQSDLTMAHNLTAISSPSSLRSRTLITTPAALGTQGVMDKLKQLSRLQSASSPVPNTQGRTPTLPCWHKGVHPLMPTFIHKLRCSTRK